jgi:hypothetical protein
VCARVIHDVIYMKHSIYQMLTEATSSEKRMVDA